MKLKLIVPAGCLLLQVFAAMAGAEDLPPDVHPQGDIQTLTNMPPPEQLTAAGTLKGYIQTIEGAPLSGGKALFYNEARGPMPLPERYWRVPDETASLDAKGGFSIQLPQGRYYIGAVKRKGDKSAIGPPADGDIHYDGKELYEVLPATLTDVGTIRGGRLFFMGGLPKSEAITAIEGAVFDSGGKPLENVVVFAKSTLKDRPLFVSTPTDKNGAYSLKVAGAGTFFLKASDLRGRVATGKLTERGGDDMPVAVTVREGEIIKSVNLTGVEIFNPDRKPGNSRGK